MRFDQTALWFRSWLLAGLVAMTAVLWKAWWRRRTAARRARFGKQAAKIHVPRAEQWLTVTAAFWIAFYVAAATWQALYGFGDAFQGYPQPVLKLGSLQCGHRRRPVIACS